MMDNDTLGDHGENKFREWANMSGFSVNESKKDVTGWDFIIEPKKLIEDNKINHQLNPELSKKHFTIGIQVKTSYSYTNCYISLKHMRRKISENRAEFFCYILLNKDNDEIETVHFIHVWQEQIEATYKKIREHKQKNESENKKEVNIKATDKDELLKPYPASMSDKIYEIMSNSNYVKEKEKLRNTMGYKNGVKSKNFVATIDEEDCLSNFFLGHKQTIELKNVEIKDDRFGIELVEQHDKLKMGFIDNEDQNINIILGNIDSGNKIEAKVPVYGYQNKTRFAHDLFDIHIDFNIEQKSMNISLSVKNSIKAFYLVHKALMENPTLTIIKDNKPKVLKILPNDFYNNNFMDDFNYISQVYEILKKANFLEKNTDKDIILNQKESIETIYMFYISNRLINTPLMFNKEKIQSTDNYIISLPLAIQLSDKNLIVVIFIVKFNTKDVTDVCGNSQGQKSSIWLTKDNYQLFDIQCITLNEYQNYIDTYKELLKKKYKDHTIISQ
jgi:hypothetical protein